MNRPDTPLHEGSHTGKIMEFKGVVQWIVFNQEEPVLVTPPRPRSPYIDLPLSELTKMMQGQHPLARFVTVLPECYVRTVLEDDFALARIVTDYSGMSDVEIYRSILDRYTAAFGNFEEMRAFQSGWQIGFEYMSAIQNNFDIELMTHFGSYERVQSVYREMLFGNMNDAEVRVAIGEKFQTDTLRDMMWMAYMMGRAGADTIGFSRAVYNYAGLWLEGSAGNYSPAERQMNVFAHLDSPMNWTDFTQRSQSMDNLTEALKQYIAEQFNVWLN
jgi:hypothetical protein